MVPSKGGTALGRAVDTWRHCHHPDCPKGAGHWESQWPHAAEAASDTSGGAPSVHVFPGPYEFGMKVGLGKVFTSRREHNRYLKERGLVEVPWTPADMPSGKHRSGERY